MKRTDLPTELQQLLREVPYATIATVRPDGQPWSTPLYVVFDKDLTMYWVSTPTNQHSQNILCDPRIFATVFDSHAPEGAGFGLYLQMTAQVLTKSADIAKARKLYTSSYGEPGTHNPFGPDCLRKLYKATPTAIWHNCYYNASNEILDARRQLA